MERLGLLFLSKPKGSGGYHKIKILTDRDVNFNVPEPITVIVKKIDNLHFQLFENEKQANLWRYLIQKYHYLEYSHLVERHLK